MIRTYSRLIRITSYEERFEYLKLSGIVGEKTFGFERHLNQRLYTSDQWLRTRDIILVRDEGCDLAHFDHPIIKYATIHHINPITIEDIEEMADIVFDPENLVTTASLTHKAIHFGDKNLLPKPLVERRQNDTIPWR